MRKMSDTDWCKFWSHLPHFQTTLDIRVRFTYAKPLSSCHWHLPHSQTSKVSKNSESV